LKDLSFLILIIFSFQLILQNIFPKQKDLVQAQLLNHLPIFYK